MGAEQNNDTNQTNQTNQADPQKEKAASEAWQEVGRQFQALGDSLAAAFRTSWNDPQHRERLQDIKSNLEAMVSEIDKAITDAASSQPASQARAEAQRAAESLRDASEQTVQAVRPQVLAALKQVSDELQRLVGHIESQSQQPPAGTSGPTTGQGGASESNEEKKP